MVTFHMPVLAACNSHKQTESYSILDGVNITNGDTESAFVEWMTEVVGFAVNGRWLKISE